MRNHSEQTQPHIYILSWIASDGTCRHLPLFMLLLLFMLAYNARCSQPLSGPRRRSPNSSHRSPPCDASTRPRWYRTPPKFLRATEGRQAQKSHGMTTARIHTGIVPYLRTQQQRWVQNRKLIVLKSIIITSQWRLKAFNFNQIFIMQGQHLLLYKRRSGPSLAHINHCKLHSIETVARGSSIFSGTRPSEFGRVVASCLRLQAHGEDIQSNSHSLLVVDNKVFDVARWIG